MSGTLIAQSDKTVLLETDNEAFAAARDALGRLAELARHRFVAPLSESADAAGHVRVRPGMRGHVKQALLKAGFPVEDLAGYRTGDELDLHLRTVTAAGAPLALRPYQKQAVDGFLLDGSPAGGNGVIVMPCGAGKTLVGMAIMERVRTHTLILATK